MKIECDFLVLTECWLSALKNPPQLANYDLHYTQNCKNQNDGIVIYIKNTAKYIVEEPVFQDANCLITKINQQTAIISIYRSPSFHSIDKFLKSLEVICTDLKAYQNVVLVGDINIDIKPNRIDKNYANYLDSTSVLGFIPGHYLPTREHNCLDHILLKTRLNTNILVIDTFITDHKPVVVELYVDAPDKSSTMNTTKNYKLENSMQPTRKCRLLKSNN